MSERKTNSLGKLMGAIDKIGTVILQNLTFLICCIPVVTIAASWSGLCSSVRYNIRGESWFAGFKKGFKTRFLRNTLMWVFCAVVCVFFLDSIARVVNYINEEGVMDARDVLNLCVRGLFLLAFLMFSTVMVPVNLYLPTDVNRWTNNTWHMVFRAPLRTLIATALLWAPVAIFLFAIDIFFLVILVFAAAYFSIAAVVITLLLKKPLIRLLEREREENPNFDEIRAEDLED